MFAEYYTGSLSSFLSMVWVLGCGTTPGRSTSVHTGGARRHVAWSRYTCADNVRRVAVFYGSTGTVDDQAWGALWLHKATRDQSWLDKVRP